MTMKVATLALIMRTDRAGRLQVLLGRKKKAEIGTDKLNGPGGKQEPGESIVQCAVRETYEEVQLRLSATELEALGPAAIITFFAAGVPDFQVHVFLTSTFEGTPQDTDSMTEICWHPTAALPWHRMHDGDQRWLPSVLRGEKFRANLYYTGRGEGFIKFEPLPL